MKTIQIIYSTVQKFAPLGKIDDGIKKKMLVVFLFLCCSTNTNRGP